MTYTTYGLIVRTGTGDRVAGDSAVDQVVSLSWPVLPAAGAEWVCCRTPQDLPHAIVARVVLGGGPDLDAEDVEVWVEMTAPRRLLAHLVNQHNFRSLT